MDFTPNMSGPPKGPMGPPEKEPMGPPGKRPMGPPGKRPMGPPGGRAGVPPMGPPPEGGYSEEERVIMPDFKKWRAVLFKLDGMFVLTAFILECLLFFVMVSTDLIQGSVWQHFLKNVLLPSGISVAILLFFSQARRRFNEMDLRLNLFPVMALIFIDLVLCLAYSDFAITLCVFVVPIVMTAMFANKKLCKVITVICIICVLLVMAKQLFSEAGLTDRTRTVVEGVIAIVILTVSSMASNTVLGMTQGQRDKLLDFTMTIKAAHNRERAANMEKSTFLANMSHEIRTPINAILGMNEMILRENEDAQIAEYATSIRSASTSLLSLVNDVLDISKIESGKMDIIDTVYETSSFVHDCYNMVVERANKKNLEVHVDCNPSLPCQLKGDEVRFRQIVTNLLSNAVKYTEKGFITLKVDGKTENDQFFMLVTVKDTGIGIKEENQADLFSQFTRFDMDRNRNIEGTGLGLAITKQLLDLMQGEIHMHSVYGEGSTFTVTIPQKVEDPMPMGDFMKRYRDVSHDNAKYQQSFEAPDANILVVDDVEVNLKVMVNLLKATKVKVDTAKSGKECLDKVTKKKYDVIFMDHMMPEMNGVETYLKMKDMEENLNRSTPVIMLTANAITGVREKYLEYGFSAYLSKPVRGDKLEEMILKYLPEDKVQNLKQKKVETVNAAAASESADGSSPNASGKTGKRGIATLQKFYQNYPKVDLATGLSYCGQDTEAYLDIVEAYGANPRLEELQALFTQKNIKDYGILAHGIKSSSMSIGLSALSEMAFKLENAANENDWETIAAEHEAFVEEYQLALKAIKETLA